ncbi:MAG: MCE family protein [Candidatus Omnitrophica bacterium]|nr:MCE family protein [Candidatus Omnitrophota bacterium]
MVKDDVMKQFWAGIFFLAGLALVAGVVFFIGFNKGFSEPKTVMTVLFDKVGGLTEGAPVRLSGVTVGLVDEISFLNEEVRGRGIQVRLSVYKKFEEQVRRSTRVSVQTEGVLGSKYIEIGRYAADPAIDIERPVLGEPMLDVYDIAEVLRDTAKGFSQTSQDVSAIMSELKHISRKTKRILDRVEQRVIDGTLIKVF